MNLLLRLLFNALAVLVVAWVVPGVTISGYGPALFAGLVIAVINTVLRPILQFFALPFSVVTLGLFSLVVNAFLFWLAARFVPGFDVVGFWPAFWGAIVFWVVSVVTGSLLAEEKRA